MSAADRGPARDHYLAEAYHVLSDPDRRAAYDRALGRGRDASRRPAPVPVPVRVAAPGGGTGPGLVPGPPLRAGPVRVDGPPRAPAGGPGEEEIMLAALAALALRGLARDRDWPGRDRDWPW